MGSAVPSAARRAKGLSLALLVAFFASPASAKEQKVHGYVTAVHSPASFDIDDYRILPDQSVTIEFATDDDDQNAADYPKDIRVGSEIEIRGEYDAQTHELRAKSIKVYTRESRRLKRTAILDQVPQLHQKGAYWEGSFRADGQNIVVDGTTLVSIVPNAAQKSAKRREEKAAKQAGARGELPEQSLTNLNEVHVNMYVSYEGTRLEDGRIAAKKLQFRDNEKTTAEVRLWNSFSPRVNSFKGAGPTRLIVGAAGKYELTLNPDVQNYVRNLGLRLIPASQKDLSSSDANRIPFQFFVTESKGVNATATPNGVVVVHRELLAMVETEGELAAVMGHEIAHATQEHMLRQMEFHKKKRLLLQIGAAVAEAYGKYNVRDLLNLASAAITNGYERYLENQADRVGMEYMLAAGFDPREAPHVWKTFASRMGDAPINFWSDHDSNTTRRSYLMSELAVNYKGVDFDALTRDSDEFQRIHAMVGGSDSKVKSRPVTAVVRLPAGPSPPPKASPAPQNSAPPAAPAPAQSTQSASQRPSQQEAAPTSGPTSVQAVLDHAYDALRASDYATAIDGFRQAIIADPTALRIHKDLAYTYLKIGENSLALDELRETMRLAPHDDTVALEYAFLCHEAPGPAPCPNEARRIFDRIRHSPAAADAATAEKAFQNIDVPLAQGIERWKKAIAMGADDSSAHYELASLAEQRDELPLAAEQYEKAWHIQPDHRTVLVDLGRVWLAMGRTEDGNAALLAAVHGGEPRAAEMARELLPDRYPYIAEFRRGLLLDPKNADLRRELAFLLLSMGKQPAAEQEFRIITDEAPGDLLAAVQLGFLLHARGDQAGAQPLFDRVLAGKDEDLGNRVRAVLHQPQVLQSRPDQPQAAALSAKEMADRSIKAGYLKDAVKYLLTAAEGNPADAEVMLRLGWAYNNLHDDVNAIHWFDMARQSSDPAIAAEAQKAWRNLRSPTERFRTTGWFFPLYSSRWRDLFGYGQVKTELRTGLGFRPYVSARVVGDTRQTEGATLVPQYLSESSVILGIGVATTPWHGLLAWGEAGRAFNYLSHQQLKDYRGGVSMAYGTGHPLRGESPGWFATTSTDAVFLSRFGNDFLVYNQEHIGYTLGEPALRTQVSALVGVTFDQQRQYWANYAEAGVNLRFTGSALPQSMYFTLDAVRGIYLVNIGNPRPPNYYDLRIGVWYAFTR
ncbi:MAG TPA: M48 family metalloprotease [Bryobacteraceae bacterium]|nr:M48 family metalloprotease [Bryobacteraceae bacterium]